MDVGCTATRKGMTADQRRVMQLILRWLRRNGPSVLHEGHCVGGDEQISSLARRMGYRIVAHPPTYAKYRSYFLPDEMRTPKDYHDRNRDIVDETRILVAAPEKTQAESVRSGTWWTVDYARDIAKPIIIVYADGRVVGEGNWRTVRAIAEAGESVHGTD